MDAVELPMPVDVVAAPKLIGPEGFVRVGVTVKDGEVRSAHCVSSLVGPSIERCESYLTQNVLPDVTLAPIASESASLAEFSNANQVSNSQSEFVPKGGHNKGKTCPAISPTPEGVQWKMGKMSRSNSSGSKRLRMSQSEDLTTLAGVSETKELSDKLVSDPTKCISLEKSQLVKQKSNASGRRGEKRSSRVSMKAKFDSSCMKFCSASFSSGGNSFLGLYSLKSDFHDLTKLVDDPPLNELLDGTYNYPNLSKDKGKKAENTHGSVLNSVRKILSILLVQKPVLNQDIAETDSYSNKMSSCHPSPVFMLENSSNGDKEQSCASDVTLCHENSCTEPETLPNPLDLPLHQHMDVLERIALPPPRDLGSLLLDANKPGVSKNASDLRSGKQIHRRPCLPPFPWSHASSGHCRTNSDVVKLSMSRSPCQGRWAKVEESTSSNGIADNLFTDIDSLTYNEQLVPSGEPKVGGSVSSLFANLPSYDSLALSQRSTKAALITLDGYCPRLLAAAQTLYDIATYSLRHNPDGRVKCQKKTSQKAMKVGNVKPSEKLEKYGTPFAAVRSDLNRNMEQIIPAKRPRLSSRENKDAYFSNYVKKGPINWSPSRSSRSFSGKSSRGPIVESNHPTRSNLKQSCMMPPRERVLNKGSEGKQKSRILFLRDWKRGRDKHN